jgi:hypothetical protein
MVVRCTMSGGALPGRPALATDALATDALEMDAPGMDAIAP